VSYFSSFFIENNLSYLVGGNITSVAISTTTGGNITLVAISATAGGNITSVALSDTCFLVIISLAFKKLLNKKIVSSGTRTRGLQPASPVSSCCAATYTKT